MQEVSSILIEGLVFFSAWYNTAFGLCETCLAGWFGFLSLLFWFLAVHFSLLLKTKHTHTVPLSLPPTYVKLILKFHGIAHIMSQAFSCFLISEVQEAISKVEFVYTGEFLST